MGNGLKLLSLVTGSSEKTLLNARAEIAHSFGSKSISNQSEKNYVINTLIEDLNRYIDWKAVQKNKIKPYEVMCYLLERRINNRDRDFLVIYNRVMAHFYGVKQGDAQSLEKAIIKLTDEIGYILSNDYEK